MSQEIVNLLKELEKLSVNDKERENKEQDLADELRKLTRLRIEGHNISVASEKYLTKALKENKTLTSIDLGSNHISSEGVRDILEASKENKNIIDIYFIGYNIEDELSKQLKENVLQDILAKNEKEAKASAKKLENIFKPNQNQKTKYLSSSLLKDLLPRAYAVSEILKEDNEEAYNSLKQFLGRKLKESDMVAKKEDNEEDNRHNKEIRLNDDIKREIYKLSGIDVFGDDFELKRITPEVLKIAIVMQMQSEINLYSKFLEEKKYPTKDNKPDWQSLDIEVLKPAIEIFLDPKKQPTEKFPNRQSRINFLEEKIMEEIHNHQEELKKITKDLKQKSKVVEELARKEEEEIAKKALEKIKILEKEFKKLKEEKKDKDCKGKSKLEESDSEDLPNTSFSMPEISHKAENKESSCKIL